METNVMKLDLVTGKALVYTCLKPIHQGSFVFGNWVGVDRRDMPLAVSDLTNHQIVSINWQMQARRQ